MDPLEALRRDLARLRHFFQTMRSLELYHVTKEEDVPSILDRGLDSPVHLLSNWRAVEALKAASRQTRTEQGGVLLRVTLPGDWELRADEVAALVPKGSALSYSVISDSRIPPGYITVIERDFWELSV